MKRIIYSFQLTVDKSKNQLFVSMRNSKFNCGNFPFDNHNHSRNNNDNEANKMKTKQKYINKQFQKTKLTKNFLRKIWFIWEKRIYAIDLLAFSVQRKKPFPGFCFNSNRTKTQPNTEIKRKRKINKLIQAHWNVFNVMNSFYCEIHIILLQLLETI